MNHVFIKNRNFRYLMFGKLISLLGSNLQTFAFSLYVLNMTGSATEFSKMLVVSLIPEILLTPFAGVLVDKIDRKKTIVGLDLLSGIVIGIYAYLFISGFDHLLGIYILCFMTSMISAVFQPAILTIIPSVVSEENLEDANSVNAGIMNVGELLSPFLAGFLLYRFGIVFILVMNAISFILSAISESMISVPPILEKNDQFTLGAFKEDFKEGLFFINKTLGLKMIIFYGVAINFILSPITTVGSAFLFKVVLGVNDELYGIAESISASAMVIAPLVFGAVKWKVSQPVKMMRFMFLAGGAIFMMGIIVNVTFVDFLTDRALYLTLIFLEFCLIFSISIANISLIVVFQKIVPLKKMGRVASVLNASCMVAAPLGQVMLALLYDSVSATLVTVSSGLAFIAIVIIHKDKTINALVSDLEKTKSIVKERVS